MADTIKITYPGKQVTIAEKTNIKNYIVKCLGLDRDHGISIQIVVNENK